MMYLNGLFVILYSVITGWFLVVCKLNLHKKAGIIIAFNKNEDHSIIPYYLYNGLKNKAV